MMETANDVPHSAPYCCAEHTGYSEPAEDQPPGVSEHSPFPPVWAASQRVDAFVAAFGDGIVVGGGQGDLPDMPPLYARDLEALARIHR